MQTLPPHETRYRASIARINAAYKAGALTPAEWVDRITRVTRIRDERAVRWARYEYRDLGQAGKVAARLRFRADRPRHT
ncbi:hypothetical protein [Nocardiopsis protaetiae]|uniref:hypothetical protein n=1 Tax=Nocardiopsis protaetiae TaxID=3382270 RepID=UPI00387B7C1A